MPKLTSDQLLGVRLKIERTEHHIRDLELAIDDFVGMKPYEIGIKFDANTGQKIYYVTRVEEVAPRIGLIVGDALNNLRSALEHLAMQLFLIGPGGGKEKDIGFPIIDTSDKAKYISSRAAKVEGIAPSAIAMIDAIEPFKGGKGHSLWALHRLNNIDKHRRLGIVGAAFRGLWVNPVVEEIVRENALRNPSIVGRMPDDWSMRGTGKQSLLKVGETLLACSPRASAY